MHLIYTRWMWCAWVIFINLSREVVCVECERGFSCIKIEVVQLHFESYSRITWSFLLIFDIVSCIIIRSVGGIIDWSFQFLTVSCVYVLIFTWNRWDYIQNLLSFKLWSLRPLSYQINWLTLCCLFTSWLNKPQTCTLIES